MKPLFNQVKFPKLGKNVFDLSHERKLSCKMGKLVPVLLEEIVPGDKFKVSTEALVRLAPMVAPVMHRVNIYMHYFFVPNRLVWKNWESFITGGVDGQYVPTIFPELPVQTEFLEHFRKGTLSDYMGVPSVPDALTEISEDGYKVSALPFRAYQMIYNEYYRDQNLEPKVDFTIEDDVLAVEIPRLLTLRNRCWEKDYFTSALPWAQRGGDVLIPMEAEINYLNEATIHNAQINQSQDMVDGNLIVVGGKLVNDRGSNPDPSGTGIHNIESIENGSLTINDLRRATRLQQWLERNARAGSRYIEQIFAHFGVKSSDARLQRPEYLGGSKAPVVISEVLNMSSTTTSEPLGQMAGHGISVGQDFAFNKYFEEHGYVIGIMSVLPRTAYMQGVPRMLTKFDKFDYYFPEFANLGEQEVKKKELYWDFEDVGYGEQTFGYQSRFSEYKFKESSVHGDFRDSLNYWHMARLFDTPPALNNDFVQSDPTSRIFAVTDETVDKLYIQLYNNVRAIRSMPIFGTPTL